MSKIFCINCGSDSHTNAKCEDPITSHGIICIECNYNINNINNFDIEQSVMEYNYMNVGNLKYIPQFYNDIKILLVRRKHSITYVDFIRGKYNINNIDEIKKLINHMTYKELELLRLNDFDYLWKTLWKETAALKTFKREYINAKKKFEIIKGTSILYINIANYSEPEWGFPKGRREKYETLLDCAIREFTEETGIKKESINIYNRVQTINEEYNGLNNLEYRHIYYLGKIDNNNFNIENSNEIGEIKWLTFPEAINKIRKYNISKIKILNQIYFFILNLIINTHKTSYVLEN